MKNIKKYLLLFLVFVLVFACTDSVVMAGKPKKEQKTKKLEKVKDVTVQDYSTKSVTLSWKTVKKATGYEIYRSQKEKKDYELVGTIKNGKKSTWTDKKLKKDTRYFYKIRAICNKKCEVTYGTCSTPIKVRTAKSVIDPVRQYTYVPYRSGGTTTSGWDCSGFTKWALKEYYGVDIPKGAAAQGNSGKKISLNNRKKWKPGDVLVYVDGGRIGHVALYLGNNKLMHALNTRRGTIIQDVDYYERWDGGTRLIGVRRFTGTKK